MTNSMLPKTPGSYERQSTHTKYSLITGAVPHEELKSVVLVGYDSNWNRTSKIDNFDLSYLDQSRIENLKFR